MKFCFGTVCWGGYLERYIDIFVTNYITLFKRLIALGVNYIDIVDPKIVCSNEVIGPATENATKRLLITTGKTLYITEDKHKYTNDTIMYSTRNRLRADFRKSYPHDQKVYFYFPIDDNIRQDAALELFKLSQTTTPTACMFKFLVKESPTNNYMAGTRPISSHNDIHPGDWGGYCAYTILDEDECPLYPKIAIPNIAFYIELYKAGYKQYASKYACIDHLRHGDSHHYKVRNTKMSKQVTDYLLNQKKLLCEGGM